MTAPLVRARVVEYLAQHVIPGIRRWNGQIPTSAETHAMAHDLGVSPHDVNETLWMLQKQQVVTFRERKGPKGSVISRIRIADTALNGAHVSVIRRIIETDEELAGEVHDIKVVTKEMAPPPSQALRLLLEEMGGSMRVREANLRLGYKPDATAIYSLAKKYPAMFVVGKGEVRLVAPAIHAPSLLRTYPNTPCTNRAAAPEWCVEHDSLWHRGDMHCVKEWERRNSSIPTETGAGADAQNDASTAPAEAVVGDDLPAILVPPVLADYPAIAKVLKERRQRDVTADAAARLSEVGLDELAIPLMEAMPPMSALETEVVILATLLGWLDG